MNSYFKIKEMADLYDIGTDTLRHYDKIGLLKPSRSSNGYRLYSVQDLYKLNLIRDLRNLDFSLEAIGNYLEKRTIEQTTNLLNIEYELVNEKIQELEKTQAYLKERINLMDESPKIIANEVNVLKLQSRYCIQELAPLGSPIEVDYTLKKLQKRNESLIPLLTQSAIGAFFDCENSYLKKQASFNSVFFILKENQVKPDFVLAAGSYLSIHYRGSYQQSFTYLSKLYTYINEHKLVALGPPFELYKIDFHETLKESEFLTEIQIQVVEST